MYSIVDLFCGTGALSSGISQGNPDFVTVAGIDLNKPASDTAKANHKSATIICGDIEQIAPDEFAARTGVDKVDVVVGGPPCQGFSSLRPSRGSSLDDPRNQLYKSFIRYVAYLKPRVILMENVLGLINANNGELLEEIIRGFSSIGYTVDWRVLNAANYGVPQKRERLFLIGLRNQPSAEKTLMFPEPTHFCNSKVIGTKYKSKYVTNKVIGLPAVSVWEAIGDLPSIPSGETSTQYKNSPCNSYQKDRRKAQKTLGLHSAANHSEKMIEVIRHSGANISCIPKGLVTSGYSSCYSRLSHNQPSTTITVKFTSPASSKCIHPYDNRAITPREAARLQSFDDDYVFCGSKTDIASQIGNAVPPLFGRAFATIITNLIEESEAQ